MLTHNGEERFLSVDCRTPSMGGSWNHRDAINCSTLSQKCALATVLLVLLVLKCSSRYYCITNTTTVTNATKEY